MFGGVDYLPHHDLLFDKYVPGSDGNSLTTKRVREIASDNKSNIWIGTEDDGVNILNIASGKVRRLRLNDYLIKGTIWLLWECLSKEANCSVACLSKDWM